MSHPTPGDLVLVHFGEITGSRRDACAAHVRECATRRTSLADLRWVEQSLLSGADDAPPADGLRRVLARIARQTVDRLQASQRAVADFQAGLKPLDPTEEQLRGFRQVFDAIPWTDVRERLHAKVEVPTVPVYSAFVDRAATGQEDLVIAFTELFSAPTSRHVLAFTLAASIDLIVFLLAFASGPFLFGSPAERWLKTGAVLDAADEQVFARDLLRKVSASPEGLARVEAAALSPGERQLVLLLVSQGLAAPVEEDGQRFYLLDASVHRSVAESLSERRLPLRAAVAQPASG